MQLEQAEVVAAVAAVEYSSDLVGDSAAAVYDCVGDDDDDDWATGDERLPQQEDNCWDIEGCDWESGGGGCDDSSWRCYYDGRSLFLHSPAGHWPKQCVGWCRCEDCCLPYLERDLVASLRRQWKWWRMEDGWWSLLGSGFVLGPESAAVQPPERHEKRLK